MLVPNRKLWLWPLAAVAMLLAYLLSCSDKPTEPKTEEPKDYPVYFGDFCCRSTKIVYTYYPVARQLDSAIIPWAPEGMTVSADGELLYLTDTDSPVLVLDTDSLSFVTELPYPGYAIAVSPDNQLIAFFGDGLRILRTSDYQVVFSDTGRIGSGVFSAESRSFYCVAYEWFTGPRNVYRVDLADSANSVTRRSFTEGSVAHVIPTIDESKWLLYMAVSTDLYAFAVYDVSADSIVFGQYLSPGCGKIAIMPNGKYAFYGNPGSIITGTPSTSDFTIFDIENNRIDEVVCTEAFIDSLTPAIFLVGSMVVTPDNRWLIAQDAISPHSILLYDIEKRELVDYHCIGSDNVYLSHLTVQKQE